MLPFATMRSVPCDTVQARCWLKVKVEGIHNLILTMLARLLSRSAVSPGPPRAGNLHIMQGTTLHLPSPHKHKHSTTNCMPEERTYVHTNLWSAISESNQSLPLTTALYADTLCLSPHFVCVLFTRSLISNIML